MRRRRPMLLTAFGIALIIAYFFIAGPIGGPSGDGEGTPDQRTPRPPPPEADVVNGGTASNAAETKPTVAGRLVGPEGKPLPGASVRIVSLDDGTRKQTVVRTDEKGRFSDQNLVSGAIIFVEILKRGYPATRKRYTDGAKLARGETVALDLDIPPTFSLAGFVRSSDSKVVAGARVRYGNLKVGITGAAGRFRIEGIDALVLLRDVHPRLYVSAEGFPPHEKVLNLDGAKANFDDIEVVLGE